MEKVNDISKSKTLYVVVIIFLMAALVITVITAVSLGQVNIKVSDTYKIIFGKLTHHDEIFNSSSKAMIAIVWNYEIAKSSSWLVGRCRTCIMWMCDAGNG